MDPHDYRVDRAGRLARAEVTSTGGAVVDVFATTVGVFDYLMSDGTTRSEYRSYQEVFHPESLKSMKRVAFTLGHPPEGKITLDNWDRYAHGHTEEEGRKVRHDNKDYVGTKVVLTTRAAVTAADKGDISDVSCGYRCDAIRQDGVFEGKPYQYVQTNIRYHHIAGLAAYEGRAGHECRMRLDSASEVLSTFGPDSGVSVSGHQTQGRTEIMKVKVNGKEYEKGSDEHIAALEADRDRVAGERDAAQPDRNRADSAEARVKVLEAKIAADSKAATIERAILLLGNRIDKKAAEGSSALEIMKQVIGELRPGVTLEGKSDEYVMGYFAALHPTSPKEEAPTTPETPVVVEGSVQDAKRIVRQAPTNTPNRTDSGEEDPSQKRLREAYEKKAKFGAAN